MSTILREETVNKRQGRRGRTMLDVLPNQDEGGAFCDELQRRWLEEIKPQRDNMLATGHYRTGAALAFGMSWLRGFRFPPKFPVSCPIVRADMLDVLMMTDRPFGSRRFGHISRFVLGHRPRLDDTSLVIGGERGFLTGNFFKMPQGPGQPRRLRLRQSGKLVNSWRKGKLYVRGMTDYVDLCVGVDRKLGEPVTIYRFRREDLEGHPDLPPPAEIVGFARHELPAPGEVIESEPVELEEVVAEAREVIEVDTCVFGEKGQPKFRLVDPFAVSRRKRRELKALFAMDARLNSGDYNVQGVHDIRCLVQFPISLMGEMVRHCPGEFIISPVMNEHVTMSLRSGLTRGDGSHYQLKPLSSLSGQVAAIERGEDSIQLRVSSGETMSLPPCADLYLEAEGQDIQPLEVGAVIQSGQTLGDYVRRLPNLDLEQVREQTREHFVDLLEQFLLDQSIIDTSVAAGVLVSHQYVKSLLPLASRSLQGPPLWYLDLSSLLSSYDEDSGYLVVAIESLDFPLESFNVDGLNFVFDHRSDASPRQVHTR